MKKHLLMALGLLLAVLAQAQTMAVVDGIKL